MKHTGADWAYISFPGGGERIAALLGGHVDMMMMDPSEAGEQVRAGKLRPLAQISAQRLESFKDIPTVAEAGFNIPDVPQTRGVVGPPEMPADAVAYYERLFDKMRQTAGWKKFLAENQLEQVNENSAAARAFLTTYEDQLRGIFEGSRSQSGAVRRSSVLGKASIRYFCSPALGCKRFQFPVISVSGESLGAPLPPHGGDKRRSYGNSGQ